MSSQPNLYEAIACYAYPANKPSWLWQIVAKLERALACMVLLACFPFLCIVCAITILLSRQSPLIAHRRAGKRGRDIWVFKVRTMWGGKPRTARGLHLVEYLHGSVVPDCKCRFDPRVTSRFAAFCRKYSIDELPQLWLVVRGEMSIVGPRPMTHEELARHYGSDAIRVLQAKPGLTGLWQIRGRSNLKYHQRRRLDRFMLEKWSLRLYTAILIASVPKVLTGKDAW